MEEDDVDRLYKCFKCGLSPPESAMRERKRRTRISLLNNETATSTQLSTSTPSPPSAASKHQNAAHDHNSASPLATTKQGKQFSPLVFYGSPQGVPPKKSRSLLRLLREIRIDLNQQNKSSSSREEVWATFPRQDEAMKFLKGHDDVRVFSYQDHFSGQRRFLISTYKDFWQRYKTMEPKFRHHYEVIQEGLPCHLYFDLEFSKRDNPSKNGDEMVDLLISVVLEALLEKYSIEGNEDWIVELDSSTEEKFSRHVVVRIPNTAFKDNIHAGAFVAEICSRIVISRTKDERFEKMFLKKDSISNESPSHLFVDTAVYSRNRCFRLALSSKAGKKAILLPTGRFKCKDMGEEEMFMASLICNMDVDCGKLLVCKMELDCIKTLQFDTEVAHNYGKYLNAPLEFSQNDWTNDTPTTYFMGKSPFPTLDKFIEYVASTGNVTGKIRSWYWFSEDGLIVYSMLRNRYCERIGREHKSNHVMYVVDLRRISYYQKCYDPDCRGYRSPMRPVPHGAVPELSTYFESALKVHPCGLTRTVIYPDFGNDQEYNLFDRDQRTPDSCSKDPWWSEATKVADDIEIKQNPSVLNMDNLSDEEDDWWMAVEKTASQAEQNVFRLV
ncbi:hypothetical protein ACFE04_027914 [Oxalis oulophora]